MYTQQKEKWLSTLTGVDRLRCIINYFTRMRYCYEDGSLDFTYKGKITDKPSHLIPWFNIFPEQNSAIKIIFGHWASLQGKTGAPNLYALDTGCVWGECLTALRLEDGRHFQVNC
jgi:bis(5'-nucleosyl)-tetraphosphatase (symmetrical)